MVKIKYASALAGITKEKEATLDAKENYTLKNVFDDLKKKYGNEFEKRIFDENGNIRRFVNVYVNGENVRHLKELQTQIKTEDKISILPAVSGG